MKTFLGHFRRILLAGLLAGLAVAAVAAGWARFGALGEKPMHHDESEQAYTLGKLLEGKGYRYQKEEHHGPVLYYLTAWLCRAAGQGAVDKLEAAVVRAVPAAAGVALVLIPVFWLRRGWAGRRREVSLAAVVVAVAFGATSPTAIYYARYFVQESVFAFCFWAAVPLLWFAVKLPISAAGGAGAGNGRRLISRKRALAAGSAGVFFGAAVALKETWVLMAAAAFVGAFAVIALEFSARAAWLRGGRRRGAGTPWNWRDTAAILAVFAGSAVVLAGIFFSSFGENPAGILDSVRTFGGYFDKAFASPHDKPFGWYWVTFFAGEHRVGKATFVLEQYALIAAVALVAPLFVRRLWRGEERRLGVFSVVSSAALLLIYSVLRYKTPWLVVGILPPLWVAAGLAFTGWWRGLTLVAHRTPRPWLGGAFFRTLLLLGVAGAVVGQWKSATFLTSERFAAHERNPLAYVHSTQDVKGIEAQARRLAPFAAKEREPVFVCVFAKEYGALLWALRAWKPGFQPEEGGRVWVAANAPAKGILPGLPDPPIIISDDSTEPFVSQNVTAQYVQLAEVLRPGYTVQLRLRKDLLEQALKAESAHSGAKR